MVKNNIVFKEDEFLPQDLILVKYNNCVFEKINFTGKQIYNCEFFNCIFNSCNFYGSRIGRFKKGSCGKFINNAFTKCSFQYAKFESVLIEKSIFENCNFTHAKFDGTSLVKIKFIGKVSFCNFYYLPMVFANNILWYFENRFIRTHPGVMVEVDFSEAILKEVDFNNGISFDKINFGNHDYILLLNEQAILSEICDKIFQSNLPENGKTIATGILKAVAALPQNKSQKKLYFSKDSFAIKSETEFKENIWKILVQYNT